MPKSVSIELLRQMFPKDWFWIILYLRYVFIVQVILYLYNEHNVKLFANNSYLFVVKVHCCQTWLLLSCEAKKHLFVCFLTDRLHKTCLLAYFRPFRGSRCKRYYTNLELSSTEIKQVNGCCYLGIIIDD